MYFIKPEIKTINFFFQLNSFKYFRDFLIIFMKIFPYIYLYSIIYYFVQNLIFIIMYIFQYIIIKMFILLLFSNVVGITISYLFFSI